MLSFYHKALYNFCTQHYINDCISIVIIFIIIIVIIF